MGPAKEIATKALIQCLNKARVVRIKKKRHRFIEKRLTTMNAKTYKVLKVYIGRRNPTCQQESAVSWECSIDLPSKL